ncbi:MAG TPA: type II toxin-antitoxin system HicB family antitoxin [Aggregatilineales bacterium]|nr:type II toxin-antitoxin system HicB family antitoxin [Aggregatilineales bacterium]
MQEFNAIFEKDGDWWVATAVEISGAFSQGKTIDEARENLRDAVCEMLLAQRDLVEKEEVRQDRRNILY